MEAERCREKIKRWGPGGGGGGGRGVFEKERLYWSQATETRDLGNLWLEGPLAGGVEGPGWGCGQPKAKGQKIPLAQGHRHCLPYRPSQRCSEELRPTCRDSGPGFGSDLCVLVVKVESYFWDLSSSYWGGHSSRVLVSPAKIEI